jgi:hypothetical protein
MNSPMQSQETTDVWQADEAAMRAALSASGVATRKQLREQTGLEFLSSIGRGELPT